jgi:hypothetical protein
MNRYVVVSTTNNPDYYFYAPYIERAWNKIGWNLCVMITNDVNESDLKLSNPLSVVIRMPKINQLRDSSIAQASRLYVSNYFPLDTLLMTSDIDLLPLSDYWHPNENDITIYGYDLTWFTFYPMGYICMTAEKWQTYMNLNNNTKEEIIRDAYDTSIPHSPLANDWEEWWNWDWSMITKRLKPFEKEIKFIERGQIDIAGATLAKGRIDRYNWEETQNQSEPFIDAHAENNNVMEESKLNKFLKVFNKFYGEL